MYVESGSPVALRCVISHWLTKPRVVFWYRNGIRLVSGVRGLSTHDELMIGRNSGGGGGGGGEDVHDLAGRSEGERRRAGGVSRDFATTSSSIVSQLMIDRAHAKLHSGQYKCAPDNIQPAVVNLHVIRGRRAYPLSSSHLFTELNVLRMVLSYPCHEFRFLSGLR